MSNKYIPNRENIGDQLPDIGAMDERIELVTYTTSRNEYGEETISWTTAATVWARVEYKMTSSLEMQIGAQETVKQRVIFTFRYWPGGLNEKMKIRYNGADHDIIIISVLGRKTYHKITTFKVV